MHSGQHLRLALASGLARYGLLHHLSLQRRLMQILVGMSSQDSLMNALWYALCTGYLPQQLSENYTKDLYGVCLAQWDFTILVTFLFIYQELISSDLEKVHGELFLQFTFRYILF